MVMVTVSLSSAVPSVAVTVYSMVRIWPAFRKSNACDPLSKPQAMVPVVASLPITFPELTVNIASKAALSSPPVGPETEPMALDTVTVFDTSRSSTVKLPEVDRPTLSSVRLAVAGPPEMTGASLVPVKVMGRS